MNDIKITRGGKGAWESFRVYAAVARPFLVPAKSWKERLAQLDAALDIELGASS